MDELLVYGNDVSLPLSHGVGSALCAATNTAYEYRRPMSGRIQLVSRGSCSLGLNAIMQLGCNMLSGLGY